LVETLLTTLMLALVREERLTRLVLRLITGY
jgi:hypothetical protein